MSATSMPGFTAALSLEKANFRYVSRQAESASRGVRGVVPSVVMSPWAPRCTWPCYVDEHGECVCPMGGPLPPHGTFGL
jgi:hypothetical protein